MKVDARVGAHTPSFQAAELDVLFNPSWREQELCDFPCAEPRAFDSSRLAQDVVLYHVDEVTFEEESPRQEALENVFSCMAVPGVNLIYLLTGDSHGVNFYFGLSRDFSVVRPEATTGNLKSLADSLLLRPLQGNFRGSVITSLTLEETQAVIAKLGRGFLFNAEQSSYADVGELKYVSVLKGIPGKLRNADDDGKKFRGVDRLVDVMLGDTFAFMILAKPLPMMDVNVIQKSVYDVYRRLSFLAKVTVQGQEGQGANKGTSTGSNVTHSESKSQGTSFSHSDTVTTGTNESRGSSSGGSYSSSNSSHGTSKSRSEGDSNGKNKSHSSSDSTTTTKGSQEGTNTSSSTSLGSEIVFKEAQDWIKYFDETLLPRLDYGRGKGLFVVSTVLMASTPLSLRKLSNSVRAIYAGETENRVALLPRRFHGEETVGVNERRTLALFQLPYARAEKLGSRQVGLETAVWSNFSGSIKVGSTIESVQYAGNWMSVGELAVMAGLPQKEVVGLRLKEEVEFGLNVPRDVHALGTGAVELGRLVQSGNVTEIPLSISKSDFDRHIFVAGVTGSGKTTTCQNLLLESDWPFLVIEPAKTEYRGLRARQCPDLLVYTLGSDTVAPFRLNPFEFLRGEHVSERVDMIKASIEAAFDMEAAIPQLIEKSIYDCYELYGWNIQNNTNSIYGEHAWDDGVFAFPTLSDVMGQVVRVVKAQGFDTRLENDYIGSINARLLGLTTGAKGMMLNCRRSIDFLELLGEKVVLELECIRNGGEKSLIMGFVLTNLLQAVKIKFEQNKSAGRPGKINHLTLIEEAHRLLTRFEPGDPPTKKQGTETFADMLAEVRKYGECLVIADQIPRKLTPEVLKNTNTKIIHRLFAGDDKEAVGATMSLEEEQMKFLSNLPVGRAIVFNGSWPKAVQVQIGQRSDTSEMSDDAEVLGLRAAVLEKYARQAAKGLILFSERQNAPVSVADIEALIARTTIDELLLKQDLNAIVDHYAKASNRFSVGPTLTRYWKEMADAREALMSFAARERGGWIWIRRVKDALFPLIDELLSPTDDEAYGNKVQAFKSSFKA